MVTIVTSSIRYEITSPVSFSFNASSKMFLNTLNFDTKINDLEIGLL